MAKILKMSGERRTGKPHVHVVDNRLILDGSRKNCKNVPEKCESSIWSDKSLKNHEIDPEVDQL